MISGFDTDIAILFLGAAILFSFGFSWWAYRNQTALPVPVRWLVTVFRGVSILILLLLLFNPSFRYDETRQLKQNIAVLFDNSRSVTIEKGEWSGEQDFLQILGALQLDDTSAVRYSVYGFDRDLFNITPDSLSFDGSVTDINRSLSSLAQEPQEMDAVILVSDGIFNRGLDPTNTALRMGLPFYTIAVGDTSRLRDVLVRNVFYNTDAYTNTSIPVRAEILNDGFPDRSIDVHLYVENELAESRTIFTTESRSVHTEEFEVSFETEGTKSLRVEIPEIGEEWTTANNSYAFTVNVRDDQIRILHLAFEVHPDVGVLRHLLATDESIMLENMTWIRDNSFAGGPLPTSADTLDLIILHGFPHQNVDRQLARQIEELTTRTNMMILPLPGTRYDRVSDYLSNVPPIRVTGPVQTGGILPEVTDGAKDHPVLDLQIPDFARAAELRGPVRNIQSAGNSMILLETTFRGTDTGLPLLVLSQIGNSRISLLSAFNWYLWQQSTNAEFREFYRGLFNNVVKWTSADPEDSILDLAATRQSYEEGDAVTFRANVRTEAGIPDEDARVEIQIESEETGTGNFTMRHLGNGRFSLDAGTFPPGAYSYTGRSYRGETNTGNVSGAFVVTESILEFMDTVRRDGLLRYISEESDGAFFTFENLETFRQQLRDDGLLDFRTESYFTILRAHHSIWWFVLVILLLTAEWVLRKKYDLA